MRSPSSPLRERGFGRALAKWGHWGLCCLCDVSVWRTRLQPAQRCRHKVVFAFTEHCTSTVRCNALLAPSGYASLSTGLHMPLFSCPLHLAVRTRLQ